MASNKVRKSSSFANLLLSCLNFTLFILSVSSLAPIILLKWPPTSFGWAFLTVSSLSLLSSFLGFYSHLTSFCFVTHISLLIASSAGQLLGILSLFTKEKSSLSLLKSPRDPREAKLLVRLECGVLVAAFGLQVIVLLLSCIVQSCWVREYEELEADREATELKRSRRIARIQAESTESVARMTEIKNRELDEKMKGKYGKNWEVKNEFEG